MLIIPQCRFCNADKATCPIKQGLKAKIQQAGIKERLRYRCNSWRDHAKYKVGDAVVFGYLVSGERWVMGDVLLTGTIIKLTLNKPIYIVSISVDEFEKIEKGSAYRNIIDPIEEIGPSLSDYEAPVMERLIIRKINN